MKLKVGEILNINEYLKKIIDTEKEVDALFKFKLLGIMKEFEPTVSNFEVIRNDKVLQYGDKDEKGEVSVSAKSEKYSDFVKDINAVLGSEMEVDIKKIKAKDAFEKNVSSSYLVGLYGIMEDK